MTNVPASKPTFRNTHLLLTSSALIVGLLFFRDAMAVDFKSCTAPITADDHGDPAAAWDGDRRVFVFDTQGEQGRRVRVVGDIVELTPELFPSLFRADGQYLEDVDSITIDAREIVVAMPIRMAGGHLKLNAQRVTFKFDGLVSFVREPVTTDQSVEIMTRELDLSQSRSIPLLFATNDWAFAEAPRWNTAGKPSRTISVSAEAIVPRPGVNTPLARDAYTSFLVTLTLDRQKPEGAWTSAYAVSSGETAEAAYSDALARSFQWPDATAMKLQRIFSTDPYDVRMREFISTAVENYRGMFGSRISKVAEAGLLRLEQAYSAGTDLFGLSETSVPMTSVAHRISMFEDMMADIYGPDGNTGLMKLWDDQKLNANTVTAVDAARVKDLQADVKKKTDEVNSIGVEMSKKEGELTNIEAAISSLDVQMKNREAFLQQTLDKEQDERRQKGEVLKVVQATATVGSIIFPAAAPFVVGASAIIAAQQAMQEPNATLGATVTSMQDIATRHIAIVQLSLQIRKDWNVVQGDFGQAVDYVKKRGKTTDESKKRFEAWKSAGVSVRDNSEKLIKNLELPGSTEKLEFSHEDAAKDPEIVALLGKRNDLVKTQQTLQNDLIAMRKDFEVRSTAILETEAVIADLLALQISNDEERLRYLELSDWARRNLIRDLAREASLLRRSLYYAVGSELELPLDVTLMAEGDLVETYGDISDPSKLEKSLADARARRAATYGILLSRAKTEYEKLKAENKWNIPIPILFSADINETAGDPQFIAARRSFIANLNTEIAGAIANVDSRTPIRIPFYPDVIGTTEGGVLLGVNISAVKFSGNKPPEGNLILTVDHPRFGSMQRATSCVVVADVIETTAEGANIEPISWPTSVPSDVTPDWRANISFANELFKIQDAMYPFFAPYTMTVEVPQPREWTSPPTIESIEIQFIVAKPN
ncbi:hypothetical protein [Rhizobium johnstonii]